MTVYNIPFRTMDGTELSLADYQENIILVVNVASRCRLTPQYAALEHLHTTYSERGLTVLGFPSNQFLQELNTHEKIIRFCSVTYGVTFPVLDTIRLNGRHTHPLYHELKKTTGADGHSGRIRWNFEKFLVLPGGKIYRYSPKTPPDDPSIIDDIVTHLPR